MIRCFRTAAIALVGAAALAGGCDNDGPEVETPLPVADPGALVSVGLDGQVGVLLEELPESLRDRAVDELSAAPDDFWIDRAKRQLRMTVLRLNFRHYFYEPYYYTEEGRKQLPLPPEALWNITFSGPPERKEVEGHDVLVRAYRFDSMLLTTESSPAQSDPALAEVGGAVEETFHFPVDPTLLFQRTGYACLDENQYPPESVDAENVSYFFDDTCGVEDPMSPVCHYSQPYPTESCVDALTKHVGTAVSTFTFQRVAWDPAAADAARIGVTTNPSGPDMTVRRDALEVNRVEYKYFSPDSCAIQEQCVGGSGWRRILKFSALDHNVGTGALHIGAVNYLLDPSVKPEDVENELHGMYELSPCHKHYHFMHYGEFSFIAGQVAENQKRGFCLESTDRLSNNETTPMHTPYSDCAYQGIESGWGDIYEAGLPCQWIDITDVDTKSGPSTGVLEFRSNPDGFLCEGTLVTDENGNQVWEETDFKTALGNEVDRLACDFFPGAEANDFGAATVEIPKTGGMLTSPCTDGQIGPLRNCGFAEPTIDIECQPGQQVTLSCSDDADGTPMVVRVCEASAVLGVGTACRYHEALANGVLEGGTAKLTLTCPSARSQTEPGGSYSIYAAPVLPGDPVQGVTCVPAPN